MRNRKNRKPRQIEDDGSQIGAAIELAITAAVVHHVLTDDDDNDDNDDCGDDDE